jgi:release factor H-coupled RctB family protein
MSAPSQATKDSTPDGSTQIFDVWHNCLSQKEFELDTETDSPAQVKKLWLHRKGAAPADVGPVVIPGSRGHFSYLVLPTLANPDTEKAAFSLAHGSFVGRNVVVSLLMMMALLRSWSQVEQRKGTSDG